MNLTYSSFKVFKDYDFFIVIPSKGRAKSCNGTYKLFPHQSCLYVHESEEEEYRNHNSKSIIVTHKRIRGYGSVINSAIELSNKSKLKYMMIIDDDMDYVVSLVGNRPRLLDLGKRYEILVNAVQVMADVSIYLYLFSTSSSIVKYMQNAPYKAGFSLPQGSYIINTQMVHVRFNEQYSYYEDFDFSMEYILKHRFFISEQRTLMSGYNIDSLTDGGCNSHRTELNEVKSKIWIKDKWKSHVRFRRNSSGNIKPVCSVDRIAKR